MSRAADTATGTAVAAPQKREIVRVENALPIFDTAEFEHMQRVAGLVGFAACMPAALRGESDRETLANAVMIINKARRMGIDPFDLAAHTYVGPGKRLGYEGKIIHAYAEEKLKHGFEFEYSGEGMNRQITVTNVRPVDRKAKSIVGTVKMWHTTDKGGAVKSNWKNDPDKQLRYRGVVEWCRAWAPGFVTGVMTEDELSAFDESFEERQRGRAYVEVPSARAPQMIEADELPTTAPGRPAGEQRSDGTAEPAPEVVEDDPPFDWEKNQADFEEQLPIAATEKMLDEMIGLYDVDGMPEAFVQRFQEAAEKRRAELREPVQDEQAFGNRADRQPDALHQPAPLDDKPQKPVEPMKAGKADNELPADPDPDPAEPAGWSEADVQQEIANLRNAKSITALDAAFDNRVDPKRGELTDAQYEELARAYQECVLELNKPAPAEPEPAAEPVSEFGKPAAAKSIRVYDKAKEIAAAPDMEALRAAFAEVDAANAAGQISAEDYKDLADRANARAGVIKAGEDGGEKPKRSRKK